jgi:hypothetical protein
MNSIKTPTLQRRNYNKQLHHRLSRTISYPPSSTGTNYNLVDEIEHELNDRVIWHIIHSPER